jgi:hypothetical protein
MIERAALLKLGQNADAMRVILDRSAKTSELASGVAAIAGTQLVAGVSAPSGSHDAARTAIDDLAHVDVGGRHDRPPRSRSGFVT